MLKALDLFCGAGGAARGLQQAGFHVTGVDIKHQPRYAGDVFIQADAMTFPLDGYDLVWASPPCQAYSLASKARRNAGIEYPDLLALTRDRFIASHQPWVIENVPGAPMRPDFRLCGCMFNLIHLKRERWFETSWNGFDLRPPCVHMHPIFSVVGTGTPTSTRIAFGRNPTIGEYRAAMGIDWMNRGELSLAIPPAYSRFLAEQFLAAVHPATTPDL